MVYHVVYLGVEMIHIRTAFLLPSYHVALITSDEATWD